MLQPVKTVPSSSIKNAFIFSPVSLSYFLLLVYGFPIFPQIVKSVSQDISFFNLFFYIFYSFKIFYLLLTFSCSLRQSASKISSVNILRLLYIIPHLFLSFSIIFFKIVLTTAHLHAIILPVETHAGVVQW